MRFPLLVVPFLASVLAFAPPLAGQALMPEDEAPLEEESAGTTDTWVEAVVQRDAWSLLDSALRNLDQACVQQLDPMLWLDVRGTARAAMADSRAAREAGAPSDLCLAAQRTLAGLLDRQEVLDPQHSGDDPGAAGGLDGIADDLLFVEGRLPQTSLILIETLFELERDLEGQSVLSRAFALWPRDVRFHETTRAWRDVLPAPEDIINQLNARVTALGSADPQASGLALETIGMLHATMGVAAYQDRMFDVAGLQFDQAARALHRSASMPRSFSDDNINAQRADAAVNASMSHLGHAQEVWFANRSDKDEAVKSMLRAEESIVTAMQLRPNHDPTLNAVLFIGETWKDKADVQRVTNGDLADSREFFRRMAERFEVADWWNNYAFWCRETALAIEAAGDKDAALDLFEKSYSAYEKTIALEPDNARYVNDTGLIQLYYLHEDLDRAEKLFYRAWELGKEVCDNPFVDEDVAAENLSAYGDAIHNLAELNRQRGDLDKAKELNELLLTISPERADARHMRRQIEAAL